MGERVEEIASKLISLFPKLKTDTHFKVTSKKTSQYNCIAWAYCIDNRWMWPRTHGTDYLDGVDYWPTDDYLSDDVSNFIDAFKLKGFVECDDWKHEDGFQKIALYTLPGTSHCTHAARELANGDWTSKLGTLQDIHHGTPFTIENNHYGLASHFMKRIFK